LSGGPRQIGGNRRPGVAYAHPGTLTEAYLPRTLILGKDTPCATDDNAASTSSSYT